MRLLLWQFALLKGLYSPLPGGGGEGGGLGGTGGVKSGVEEVPPHEINVIQKYQLYTMPSSLNHNFVPQAYFDHYGKQFANLNTHDCDLICNQGLLYIGYLIRENQFCEIKLLDIPIRCRDI